MKPIASAVSAVVCFVVQMALSAAAVAATPDQQPMTAAGKPAEGPLEAFLGEPRFELKDLYAGDRFPAVLVTTEGTVLAVWGTQQRRFRRSTDGGQTWKEPEPLPVPTPYPPSGVVDENTGDILFVSLGTGEDLVWRSSDEGKTWEKEEVVLKPNAVIQWIEQTGINKRVSLDGIMKRDDGYWMRTSLGEPGVTLRHGEKKGRLLMYAAFRPHSTVHPSNRESTNIIYACAIYSDDGGATWQVSSFFPEGHTEEAGLAELHDGRIYYNSRSHKGYHGRDRARKLPEEARLRRTAWSYDGGETWEDLDVSRVLPDGGGYDRGYGMMGGLVRLPVKGKDVLLFSNTDTRGGVREKMTVWGSFDGGKTWPVKRLVYAGPSAYSSMDAGRPGTPSEGWVFLQFEAGKEHRYEGGMIARFNLAWLLGGEPTGDGELPDWLSRQPAGTK